MPAALVLVAHGSRDPDWVRPLQEIAARTQSLRPELDVRLSFLELSSPTPDEAVAAAAAAGANPIHLAPVFLGQGAHGRRDMAALLARVSAALPARRIALLPAVGEFSSVLDAIAGALAAAAR